MRRTSRLVAALAVTVAALTPSPATAQASVMQTGWWTQRPGASSLPDGGFELALAPHGPVSRAAVRVAVEAVQLTTAVLELTESSAFGAEVAAVHVCPTGDDWEPANPGPWGEAPAPDCARGEVELSRSSTGRWSGEVNSLLGVGTVSLVLLPRSHPDTQGAPIPYQLVFSGARVLAAAPTAEPAAPPPAGGGGTTQTTDPTPQRRAPVVTGPRVPSFGGAGGPPPVAITEDIEQPPGAIGLDAPPASVQRDPTPRPWGRLLWLVPLAALAGAASVWARRTARERGLAGTGA